MGYKPKHFRVEELVPRDLYNMEKHRGDQWFFDTLFDNRLLLMMDKLRNQFGPMTVNDWLYSGGNHYRGFRPGDCTVGARLSQHRFGRAADMIPDACQVGHIISVIRDDAMIRNAAMRRYTEIGAIEMGVPWLHIDVRYRVDGEIKLFYQ